MATRTDQWKLLEARGPQQTAADLRNRLGIPPGAAVGVHEVVGRDGRMPTAAAVMHLSETTLLCGGCGNAIELGQVDLAALGWTDVDSSRLIHCPHCDAAIRLTGMFVDSAGEPPSLWILTTELTNGQDGSGAGWTSILPGAVAVEQDEPMPLPPPPTDVPPPPTGVPTPSAELPPPPVDAPAPTAELPPPPVVAPPPFAPPDASVRTEEPASETAPEEDREPPRAMTARPPKRARRGPRVSVRGVVVGIVVLALVAGAVVVVTQLISKCEDFAPGADLAGCDFTDMDFTEMDLAAANLSGSVLTGADLTGAALTEVDLTGADLAGALLRDADLTEAVMTGADLTGATLARATLTSADLTDAVLVEAKAADTTFFRANLSGVDATGAFLGDADLRDTQALGAVFDEANLTDVRFQGAALESASFRESTLDGATFRNATANAAIFAGAHARSVEFDDASLVGADLTGTDLTDASLYRADMSNANLTGATIRGVRADRVTFTGAVLSGATMRDVTLAGVTGLSVEQLAAALGVDQDSLVGAMVERNVRYESVAQVVSAAASARDGDAVAGAAAYTPGPGFHPTVVLHLAEDEIAEWGAELGVPPGIAFTELVVVPDHEVVTVEICRYRHADGSAAQPITRARHRMTLTIVEAATGDTVATETFLGGEPRTCSAQLPSSYAGRTFFGTPPSADDYLAWAAPYVNAP